MSRYLVFRYCKGKSNIHLHTKSHIHCIEYYEENDVCLTYYDTITIHVYLLLSFWLLNFNHSVNNKFAAKMNNGTVVQQAPTTPAQIF